ncbi:MAG: M17 family peptidase N-terminal domain-containing protein, partial [Candidatus Binatia bacterium]
MEIRFRDTTADRIKSDLVVIPVRDQQLDDPALRTLDRRLKGQLRARISKSNFTGAEGSVLLHPTAGMLPAAYLLLVGIGAGESNGDTWRKAGAKARKEAGAIGADEFAMLLAAEKNLESAAGAIVDGAALAGYQFNQYRSNGKSATALNCLTLFGSGLKKTSALQKSVDIAQTSVPGVFLARDLVNEPPSVATAKFLGAQAQRACQGRGLSVQVWNKKKIESMKLA